MGKRIILNEDEIKSWPLTTNRLEVNWNKEEFFRQYAIVSYYSNRKDLKNLAYERLADHPFLSVAGIRAKWSDASYPFTKFFVLAQKSDQEIVLNGLRLYPGIHSTIDSLEGYGEKLQKRIIASLGIHALGKKRIDKMMYHDASLLVWDDRNFNIKKKKERVALKIEVNEYMNLVARTTTFCQPKDKNELENHAHCMFQMGKSIEGDLWSGSSIKPVCYNALKKDEFQLENLLIPKKRSAKNKNTVPYWPYAPEDYTHGKLFVIWQIVEKVNEVFKGLVDINFTDWPVLAYDECTTGKEMEHLIQTYFKDKSIWMDDPFQTAGSKEQVKLFQAVALQLAASDRLFSENANQGDMVIKLCEPKNDKSDCSEYIQSQERESMENQALQHWVYDPTKVMTKVEKAAARRILIELIIKDCLAKGKLPVDITTMMQGWEFIRYKLNHGNVYGASLSVTEEGKLNLTPYGFQERTGVDFVQFVNEQLHFHHPEQIRGAKDYMALKRNGNVYLLIDTDEIPILDANLIDEEYGRIINKDEDNKDDIIAKFKRKMEAHKYLRGYIGFHLWKSEGMNGEPNQSYSYIAGYNSSTMKITNGTKMDKMPRARRIFILHQEHPDNEYADINDIGKMLKFGLGRWDELMTYPFPFKFLYEYLDNKSESTFSLHWSEITSKKDL